MAEPVASLLRRSLQQVAIEAPASYQRLLDELGPLVIELDVDGERFALRGGPRLEVLEGWRAEGGVRIRIPRDTVVDVLDATVALGEAVESGRIAVLGRLDDVVRAHDTLLAYVHAAVRAPSVPGLLDALRAGSGAP